MKKDMLKSQVFIIFLSINILYTFFIWSNSVMSADISTVESDGVREFINMILKNIGIDFVLTSHLTRKLAHFTEFALLGVLTMCTCINKSKKLLMNIVVSLGICFLTAVTDECIQLLSPGRACQFTDIVLDFSGALSGIIFFIVIYKFCIVLKRRKKMEVNE